MTVPLARPDLFLPDPEPRQVRYTVISVDDHLVEPPDMFSGRLPARLADGAPRVIEADGQTSELPPQGSVDIAPAKKLTVTNWFVGAFKPLEITL